VDSLEGEMESEPGMESKALKDSISGMVSNPRQKSKEYLLYLL